MSADPLVPQGREQATAGACRDLPQRYAAGRRLAVLYGVSRVLVGSPSLRDAAPAVLRAVGDGLGWDYGALWVVDRDGGLLRCEQTWHAPPAGFPEFVAASRATAFAAGEGLPGSVWASGEPRWVADTAAEPGFPRLRVASAAGLRSGFGLPVSLDGRVIAVLEFLGREARRPDPELLEMATVLSAELGQFIERTRAEAALRASETRLRLVTEQAPAHLWTTDRELRITYITGGVVAQLGVDPGHYLGKPLRELAAGHAAVIDTHARALAGETGEYELETRGRRFEARVRPLRDAVGQVVGCLGLALDVTERTRAEEALRGSEERFRLLAEGAKGFAIVLLDPDGRVADWNPGAQEVFGYRKDEILGEHVAVFFTPEDRQAGLPERELEQARREGRAADDNMAVRRDGGRIWVGCLTVALRDGEVRGFAKIVRDLTEHRRLEEALGVRARQQAAVAELGRRALATPDLDATLAEAVALVVQTLGVEYCKVLELLTDGDALLLRAGIGWRAGLVGQATVGSGADSQAGYTLLTQGAVIVDDLRSESRFSGPPLLHEHRVVSGLSVTIQGQNGPFGVLGAHTTKRRKFTQDDVHFLQAVANVLASALWRNDFEERLGRERAEAERLTALDRVRREFIAAVSHDLRTPLTALQAGLGFLTVSADGRLAPEEADLLANAQRSADRLRMLVDDLITASQLEAGALALARAPLDLRGVVADAVAAVHPLVRRKGQALEADLPAPLPVDGDAQRLEQVVVNLLANAHAHTPPGTRIAVSGRARDGEVRLTVADDGPGIPPEEVERVFRRFHRLVRDGAGSGLGLANVRGIAELHGGRVWAEGAPGGGAAFHLALPVHGDGGAP